MDVRERLQSAPTLSNTLKHLIPNVCIAKNYCLKPSQLHDHFESRKICSFDSLNGYLLSRWQMKLKIWINSEAVAVIQKLIWN